VRLDTGAEVSILPYHLYDKLIPKPIIEKNGIKIETFGAFFIKPVGMIIVNCEVNNKIIEGKFLVVNDMLTDRKRKKEIETILGAELCEKLDLIK